MKETLESLLASLPLIKIEQAAHLIQDIKGWLKEMQPIKYSCLGCKYCFPAVAMNIFNQSFPGAMQTVSLSCDFEVKEQIWPPIPGEYFAFCDGPSCPVAVSTLTSIEISETLAKMRPKGLCIVGKTETENIGIDKVIKNIITNPTIHFLIVAGKDPDGHHSGKTLLALAKNGVNGDMKVIGSPGKRPILKNVSLSEVESFRRQVQVIDMIGCEDAEMIADKINELSKGAISTCECKKCSEPRPAARISSVPPIMAREPKKLKMDKAGYFVVIPNLEKKIIIVEHYSYDNKLLHTIEGKDAPAIYSTIIENGWITELSHAAYLGRELAKAEFTLRTGSNYIQDKAPEMVKGQERKDKKGGNQMDKKYKKGLHLEYFTVGYNIMEAIVSIIFGGIANSIALVGFGLDSIVESLSGAVLIWRLSQHKKITEEEEEKIEKKAMRFVAITFFILGFYVLFQSLKKLILREIPDPSLPGIIIASVSLIVMPILFFQKYKVGKRINSQALAADSKETLACSFLSLALLLGLGANYLWGFWQADSIVGIIIVIFLLREGLEVWRESKDED